MVGRGRLGWGMALALVFCLVAVGSASKATDISPLDDAGAIEAPAKQDAGTTEAPAKQDADVIEAPAKQAAPEEQAAEQAEEDQDAKLDNEAVSKDDSEAKENAEADVSDNEQAAEEQREQEQEEQEAQSKETEPEPAQMDQEHKDADNGDAEPESGEQHIKEVGAHMKTADTSLNDEDQQAANNEGKFDTAIYLKKGGMLHEQEEENKVLLKAKVTGLKELFAKKKEASGPLKRGIKMLMSKQIYQAGAKQGTYYHKLPPVPHEMVKMETSELTDVANNVETVKGDPARGVPDEALQIYKKALVKHAVAIAAKKTAELKHKKHEKAKLEAVGEEDAGRQRVLMAKVAAAEKTMKAVKNNAVKQFKPPEGVIPEPTATEKKEIKANMDQEADEEAAATGHLVPSSAKAKAARSGFDAEHEEGEHNSDYAKDHTKETKEQPEEQTEQFNSKMSVKDKKAAKLKSEEKEEGPFADDAEGDNGDTAQ